MKYLLFSPLILLASTVFGTTPHAFVTNEFGGEVSVINVSNDTVQKIIGFTNPKVVKVAFDGTLAYVGSSDGTLRVIDTITNTLLPVTVHIAPPISLALTPDAKYIYILCSNNTVTVIKTSDYSIHAHISGFHHPRDIKILPDGSFAYVTNSGNGTVSIIDISNNTIVGTIAGFKTPIGLTFTMDGTYGYITDTNHNSVYVVRVSDNTIIQTLLGFDQPSYVAVTPDKSTAFVSNTGNDTISIVRTSDNLTIGSIPIPTPKSLSVTQDGLYLYVGSDFGTVFKVRILDRTLLIGLPDFQNPSNIGLTTTNSPADSVNGCQVMISPTNVYNQITWNNGPGIPVSFTVYRDAYLMEMIVTLPAGTRHYIDLDLEPGQTYSYYVTANYANGFSSTIGSSTVTPVRVCTAP